jgi:hypothetical protein
MASTRSSGSTWPANDATAPGGRSPSHSDCDRGRRWAALGGRGPGPRRPRTVMSLMGWSSAEMASRYQHVTGAIRQDVARQVDSLIWQARGGSAEGVAPVGTSMVPVRRDTLATILNLAEAGLAHAGRPPRQAHARPSGRSASYSQQVPANAARATRWRPREKRIETIFETTQCPEVGARPAKLGGASRHSRSAWRRMGDSNSRGVAPNTLSNNADRRSPPFAAVRTCTDVLRVAASERLRTRMNETTFEPSRTTGRCQQRGPHPAACTVPVLVSSPAGPAAGGAGRRGTAVIIAGWLICPRR